MFWVRVPQIGFNLFEIIALAHAPMLKMALQYI